MFRAVQRNFAVLLVAVLLIAATTMVGPARASATSPRFVFAVSSTYDSIDPHVVVDQPRIAARLNLYDGLLRWVDNPAKLEPWLAEKHTVSPDNQSYVFTLRKGAKFHDGTEVKAADVVYSVERVLALKLGAFTLFADLIAPGSTKVVDDITVSFSLTKPAAHFLSIVPEISVVNAALVKRNEINNDWGRAWLSKNEAGSGSYSLTRYDASIGFAAERFKDHWNARWGTKPVDVIEFRTVADPEKRIQGLIAGDFQGIDGRLSREQLEVVRSESSLRIVEAQSSRLLQAIMNSSRDPMKEPEVRRALAATFDYDAFLTSVATASRTAKPQPATLWGAAKDTATATFDLDKARAHLAKVSAPLREITIASIAGDEQTQRAAALLRSGLEAIGIKSKLVTEPWSVVSAKLRDDKEMYDILFSWRPVFTPDPAAWFLAYECDQIGQLNESRYCNRDVDKLVKEARTSTDPDARRRAYERAVALLIEDAAGIWVYNARWFGAFSKRVTGIRFSPVAEGQDMRWASLD